MKKFFKIVGYIVLVLLIVVGGLITYAVTMLPNVGDPTDLKVDITPARVERGKYLANSVAGCMDCHSSRDWTKFAGPPIAGTMGKGGERFDHSYGFPGVYYSKNITPAGIGRYTDGELYRVITTGVNKEGKAMFPVMPYPYYSKMDPEDVKSVIAYLRSIPAIQNTVQESVSDFPMNIILNTIPSKAQPGTIPDKKDIKAYGAYLTNLAGCIECHTQVDKGRIIPDLAFSGGREFPFPDGTTVRSANITPDPETGIGNWTEDAFVNRFRAYADSNFKPQSVKNGDFKTMMPWTMYGTMAPEDLKAIYAYLRSVKSIKNPVVKFVPAGTAKK